MNHSLLAMATCLGLSVCLLQTPRQPDAADAVSTGCTIPIQNLASKDALARRAAIEAIVGQHRQTIRETLSLVETAIRDRDSATAKAGIAVLGELRAEEAIPLLVENLTTILPPEFAGGKAFRPIQEGAFVGALLRIGSPALEPLVKAASKSDDKMRTLLTGFILARLLGTDVALAYVDEHLQKADASEAPRLLHLRDVIDTVVRGKD